STFYFPQKIMKNPKNKPSYRNPIYLAKEYRKMIDTGKAKNQAELAGKLGISRARITQILNLLKISKDFIRQIEQIGDPMKKRLFSERQLRGSIKSYFPINRLD
ncbi:MAG: hypothetical protein O2U61_06100, partial [Candidatus Bathyarchaeota archaeon]|nr:hypothetical protein [Candidatus Bathyarchaeota archaeon]